MDWQPHKIEDNFLDIDIFEACLDFRPKINKSLIGLGENTEDWIQTKARFYEDGSREMWIEDDLFEEIYLTTYSKLKDYLIELAPEKVNEIDWMEISLMRTFPGRVNYKHVDARDKLLSVVVYLSAENKGTLLWDADEYEEIEWKANRALIFSRNENTWHSYETDGTERYTMVINFRKYV